MKLASFGSARRSPWTFLSLSVSFWFGCFADTASAQLTLLSTVQDHHGCANFGTGYASMAAWTQDRTYSQVNVAAILNGSRTETIGTSTGTFYLMTHVGMGTTTASELARASFSVTSSWDYPQLVPLFSGLILGPGTYYLVGSGSGGGWQETVYNQTLTTAPGVSLTVNNYQAHIYRSYIPGNDFSNPWYPFEQTPPYNLEFVVSAVPEPTSRTLFGVGSLCLVGALRAARGQRRA
jgi:hypothetical protein